MGIIKKTEKTEKSVVQSEVLDRTLLYVTKKYGLTSDYLLEGFKMSNKGINIVVRNKEVICNFTVCDHEIIVMLTTTEMDVEDYVD